MKNCRQTFSAAPRPMFTAGGAPLVPSSDAVYLEMNRMAGAYPFVTLSEYGRSVLARPLLYICAGTGPRRVWYNAAHHANEWITSSVLLKFMDDLFSAAQMGGSVAGLDAARLLRENRLCFMPLVNPDGVDLVLGRLGQSETASARKIARNFPAIPFPDGWKANLQGTDLNLQYPANWEKAKEIKFAQGYTGPAPRDYVGPYPLSAPESRALAAFTQAGSPDVTLSLHTQGEVIYWRFADFDPPGARALGEKLAEASGYALSETPPVSDNAGYKDWFIQDWNLPGYTIEMGLGENPLPISDFAAIYTRMAPLLAVAANG